MLSFKTRSLDDSYSRVNSEQNGSTKEAEIVNDEALDLSMKKPSKTNGHEEHQSSTPSSMNASSLLSVANFFTSSKLESTSFSQPTSFVDKMLSRRSSTSPVRSRSPSITQHSLECSNAGAHNSRLVSNVSPSSSLNLSQDLK